MGDADVVVQETGMGLAAARTSAREVLAARRPRCLVATGLAGGLSPSVSVGDAIVPDRVARENGEALPVDPELRATAALDLPERRSRRGLLVSVDRVVRTAAEKEALARATQADAVDMESAALLEEARAAGIPSLVVRAASDTARDELPDMEGLDPSAWGDRLRLVGRALTSPRTAAGLLRLSLGGARGTATLRQVLGKTLPRLQI